MILKDKRKTKNKSDKTKRDDRWVVAYETGEAPAGTSFFAAIGLRGQQVFSEEVARLVARGLHNVGGDKRCVTHHRKITVHVLRDIHPCVSINPRTGYVRINPPK